MNKKICALITDRLIEEMEKGLIPWDKPWTGVGAVSHTTGKPYSLLNQLILGCAGEWVTMNQIKAEKGHLKKGSKGRPVVFWKQVTTSLTDENGEPVEKIVPMLRYYTVFNVEDCENIKIKYPPELQKHANPVSEAEDIITAYVEREGVKLIRDNLSDEAFYSPSRDAIVIPKIEQFPNEALYYSTAFHEMAHSTGHKTRLDRFACGSGAAAFGSDDYSKEELVAELGAANLVAHVGIETRVSFRNSAAYLQGWMQVLKNDPTMIVSAAGKAEKAVNYILGDV